MPYKLLLLMLSATYMFYYYYYNYWHTVCLYIMATKTKNLKQWRYDMEFTQEEIRKAWNILNIAVTDKIDDDFLNKKTKIREFKWMRQLQDIGIYLGYIR